MISKKTKLFSIIFALLAVLFLNSCNLNIPTNGNENTPTENITPTPIPTEKKRLEINYPEILSQKDEKYYIFFYSNENDFTLLSKITKTITINEQSYPIYVLNVDKLTNVDIMSSNAVDITTVTTYSEFKITKTPSMIKVENGVVTTLIDDKDVVTSMVGGTIDDDKSDDGGEETTPPDENNNKPNQNTFTPETVYTEEYKTKFVDLVSKQLNTDSVYKICLDDKTFYYNDKTLIFYEKNGSEINVIEILELEQDLEWFDYCDSIIKTHHLSSETADFERNIKLIENTNYNKWLIQYELFIYEQESDQPKTIPIELKIDLKNEQYNVTYQEKSIDFSKTFEISKDTFKILCSKQDNSNDQNQTTPTQEQITLYIYIDETFSFTLKVNKNEYFDFEELFNKTTTDKPLINYASFGFYNTANGDVVAFDKNNVSFDSDFYIFIFSKSEEVPNLPDDGEEDSDVIVNEIENSCFEILKYDSTSYTSSSSLEGPVLLTEQSVKTSERYTYFGTDFRINYFLTGEGTGVSTYNRNTYDGRMESHTEGSGTAYVIYLNQSFTGPMTYSTIITNEFSKKGDSIVPTILIETFITITLDNDKGVVHIHHYTNQTNDSKLQTQMEITASLELDIKNKTYHMNFQDDYMYNWDNSKGDNLITKIHILDDSLSGIIKQNILNGISISESETNVKDNIPDFDDNKENEDTPPSTNVYDYNLKLFNSMKNYTLTIKSTDYSKTNSTKELIGITIFTIEYNIIQNDFELSIGLESKQSEYVASYSRSGNILGLFYDAQIAGKSSDVIKINYIKYKNKLTGEAIELNSNTGTTNINGTMNEIGEYSTGLSTKLNSKVQYGLKGSYTDNQKVNFEITTNSIIENETITVETKLEFKFKTSLGETNLNLTLEDLSKTLDTDHLNNTLKIKDWDENCFIEYKKK